MVKQGQQTWDNNHTLDPANNLAETRQISYKTKTCRIKIGKPQA